MKYRNFENHIGDSLRKEEFQLNVQELINNIHTPKKNKRRVFVLFFSIGLLVLTGSAFFISENNSENIKEILAKNVAVMDVAIAKTVNSIELNYAESGSLLNSTESINKIKKTSANNNISNLGNSNKIPNTQYTKQASNSLISKDQEETFLESRNIISQTSMASISFRELESVRKKEISLQSDKITCPSFSNRNKLYLEIIPEIGMFYPIKKLGFNNSEVDNRFLLRNRNEITLEGIQVGLFGRIRKEKSPFYISGGLTYSKLTEKMTLNYDYTRIDTTQGIISITVSQTGDTITTIYGDIIREHKISGKKIAHYSFNLIDLPLAIGFEKSANQWVYGVEAGISLNLSMKAKGNILASDTSFVNIDNVQNDFGKSIGVSYFGGVLFGREFNGMGRLYLAARVRYIPDSFSSSQNNIKQNYHFAGLNLGYIMHF